MIWFYFVPFLGCFLQRFLYSRMAWSVSCCLNYAISLTAKALKVHYFFNDHKICHKGNRLVQVLWSHNNFIWSLVSSEVIISIYGMWIPVFTETTTRYSQKTEAKIGKLPWKERKLHETQASSQSPKCLRTQTSAEKNIFFSFGKLYSFRRTSAFVNPLVRDNRGLISDGQTSGSFLPCALKK